MKTLQKPIYETFVERGKLVFRITEGSFAGTEYVYKSLKLNGALDYKIKNHKHSIDDSNKVLFEQEIRGILKDKLSKL